MDPLEAQIEHLKSALETRTTIAEAKGILMERFSLSEDAAFAVLSRLSQDGNVKVREVAAELVETRELPVRASSNGTGQPESVDTVDSASQA